MGAQRDSVGEWKVVRTTTDSLAQTSQDLVDEGYLEITHHFVGGRDWTVIGRIGES